MCHPYLYPSKSEVYTVFWWGNNLCHKYKSSDLGTHKSFLLGKIYSEIFVNKKQKGHVKHTAATTEGKTIKRK